MDPLLTASRNGPSDEPRLPKAADKSSSHPPPHTSRPFAYALLAVCKNVVAASTGLTSANASPRKQAIAQHRKKALSPVQISLFAFMVVPFVGWRYQGRFSPALALS